MNILRGAVKARIIYGAPRRTRSEFDSFSFGNHKKPRVSPPSSWWTAGRPDVLRARSYRFSHGPKMSYSCLECFASLYCVFEVTFEIQQILCQSRPVGCVTRGHFVEPNVAICGLLLKSHLPIKHMPFKLYLLLNIPNMIRANDKRPEELGVPPRTLWSNDQDPALLVYPNRKPLKYQFARRSAINSNRKPS